MIKRVIDTSLYSSFMKGEVEAESLIQNADLLMISPIVLGELWSGFKSGNQEKNNRNNLDSFLSSPRVSITTIDQDTADAYSVIYSHLRDIGTPIPTNDLWIAASALQYGARIATRDRHFLKIPQVIVEHF